MNKKLIHSELSYVLNGIFFKIHNKLGRFAREKQYSDVLEEEFKSQNINHKREIDLNSSGNRFDFLIENKIVVEVKAKPFVTKSDYYQVNRYLESSGIELGLIVNFRHRYLKPKRIVNAKLYYSDISDKTI